MVDLRAASQVDIAELTLSHFITTQSGGRLALTAIPAPFDQLLRMTRLDRISNQFDTLAQAIDHIAGTDV